MTNLAELQTRITATRAARGFTNDPTRMLCLLTEEVGELASEIKGSWSTNYPEPDARAIADEVADIFVLTIALGAAFDIDLGSAVERKFFVDDGERDWPSAATP